MTPSECITSIKAERVFINIAADAAEAGAATTNGRQGQELKKRKVPDKVELFFASSSSKLRPGPP